MGVKIRNHIKVNNTSPNQPVSVSNYTALQMRTAVISSGGTVDTEVFDSEIDSLPVYIRENASMIAMLPTASKPGSYYAFDNRPTAGGVIAVSFTRATQATAIHKQNRLYAFQINEPVFDFVDSYETEKQALIDTALASADKATVVNFLPSGYVTDGSVDYSVQIKAAVDNGKKYIIFPPFPIRVADTGISFRANQVAYFPPGSELWMKPGLNGVAYMVINLRGSQNVTLINPKVRGDYGHGQLTSDSYEGGVGINLSGSNNAVLYDPISYDTQGDGMYLHVYAGLVTENSTIYNPICYDSGRNGMSLTGADSTLIQDPIMVRARKNNPCAGIDIEPGDGLDPSDNIEIYNLTTWDNKWSSLQIGLSKRYASGPEIQPVNIHIENQFTDGEGLAMWFSWSRNTTRSLHGSITLLNPHFNNGVPWETANGPVTSAPNTQFEDVALSRGSMNDANLALNVLHPEINVKGNQLNDAQLETFFKVTTLPVATPVYTTIP